MAKEYLDKAGLTYFWGKLKNIFAPKASPAFTGTPTAPTAASGTNTTQIATTAFVQAAVSGGGGESILPYGVCDSTSTSTAFTATVPGVTELKNGLTIVLKNGVVTSAAGFTININNLGAKPVYNSMTAATQLTTQFNVNYTIMLIYDTSRVTGGCWLYYFGFNTTYSAMSVAEYQAGTSSSSRLMTPARLKGAILYHTGPSRMQTNIYTATASVTTIPIGISGFDASTDLLMVFINGLFALGKYTVSGTNIVLNNAIAAGNEVYFVVYKG